MLIYIYGEDTFRSHQYLKQQIERFKKERDPQGMNVVILDGQKEDSGRLWSEIKATPFLAEKRMVIVKNVLSNKDADLLASFVDGIKNKGIPETNVVIFYQSEPVGKSKICAELAKILGKPNSLPIAQPSGSVAPASSLGREKWVFAFEKLDSSKLANWIKEETARRGGKIDSAALAYLAKNIGQDTWYADSLISQLIAHAGDKEISLADVQLFLEEKVDDNIFNMVDAIVAGNGKLAFKLINEQRRLGEEDAHIFGMIARQFRILISLRDLFNRQENITSDAMAKTLDLHPYVVKKSLPFIKKYSLDKLRDIYNHLLEIDIKTKTGFANQSLLIDLFVGRSST